jgi:hypothetical protein
MDAGLDVFAGVAMRRDGWIEDAGTRHPYPRSDEARWRPRHQHMANATLPRVASPFLSYHLTIEISGDRAHRDLTQRPVLDTVFVISTTPEWRNRAIPTHPPRASSIPSRSCIDHAAWSKCVILPISVYFQDLGVILSPSSAANGRSPSDALNQAKDVPKLVPCQAFPSLPCVF